MTTRWPLPAEAWLRSWLGRRSSVRATPLRSQVELGDCGAAGLGVVLAYHGRHVPADEIREACGLSRNGLTAATIARTAADYGLHATGRRMASADAAEIRPDAMLLAVRRLPVPSIVLLRGNHFVVLEGVTRDGRVAINDPASGRRRLEIDEFGKSFSNFALTFTKNPDFRTGGRPDTWARACLSWLAPYRRLVLFAVLAGLLAGLGGTAGALLLAGLIDRVVAGVRVDTQVAVAGLLGAATVTMLAEFALRRCTSTLGTAMSAHWSRRLVRAVLSIPGAALQRRWSVATVQQIDSADMTPRLIALRLIPAVGNLATLLPLLAVMAWFDRPLTVIAAVGTAVVGAPRWVANHRSTDFRRRLGESSAHRAALAFIGFSSIEALHAAGADSTLLAKLRDLRADEVETAGEATSSSRWWLAVATIIEPATVFAVLGWGIVEWAGGRLGIGSLIGCVVLGSAILQTERQILSAAMELPSLLDRLGSLDRLAQAGNGRPAGQAGDPLAADRLAGLVELENVTFGYDPHQPPLLSGVTLRVEPGQRAVIAGGTGSGKTALVRIIIGGLVPSHGAVRIDGQAIAEIPREQLLRSVAFVGQRPWLVEGTVADNLTLWDEHITDELVRRALTDACLDDVLADRGGHLARVSANGRNFSAGERQRLALAQALARDPSILVLDEATDTLDPRLAACVEANIRRRGVTTIVVAQHADSASPADAVHVLDNQRRESDQQRPQTLGTHHLPVRERT
jgi:ABC-type bacteriocin/lantibiotic exporter with double-glycine peptidase domain